MGDETAFMSAICTAPDEDLPRLVFADWLEERDDPRGEYLRVDVEILRHTREGRVVPPELETRRLELECVLDQGWVRTVSRPWRRELPHPFHDLVRPWQPRKDRGSDRVVITRDWVREVGDEQARIALSQVGLMLALPRRLMMRYDFGRLFEEAYGMVWFCATWQSALAQALGVPEPLVPDREEWIARWKDT